MPKKLTTEEFIKKAKDKHGDKYEYNDNYTGSHIKFDGYKTECFTQYE